VIIEGHEIVAQACVGATAYCLRDDVTAPGDPAPGPTAPMAATPSSLADEIVKQSNLALAEAKRAGRGAHRIYAAELDDRERSRVILRQSLQRAVGEEQFLLQYHPLVDLRSGRIVGAEALVRWEHPELGMQQPDRFIPLAEASGLIVPLGRWVLRTALRELSEWARAGIDPPRVSVNISSVQLRDPDFIAAIDEALADTGCDPRRIDFELTESVLIEASSRTLTVLNALKRRGFRLALDDFGTGYSSFQYLRSLPIDKVKIDQAFVRRMAVDSSDAAIVRAIMTVARSLSLEIVAEGIETLVQRDFLRNEGCPVGQGYFFSLPLPAPAFRELLGRRVMLPVWERSA
jgi:EAL domain-containing protein (putative c-di-GMP-specific phosphodiesterase class I)